MISALKNYFRKKDINDYRIICNEINRETIQFFDGKFTNNCGKHKVFFIIFNEKKKSIYIKTNQINDNTITYIDFLRKRHLFSDNEYNLAQDKCLVSPKLHTFEFDESNLKKSLMNSNEINFAELNYFDHSISIYSMRNTFHDNACFRYLELITRDGNRITANLTKNTKKLKDIIDAQIYPFTELPETCVKDLNLLKIRKQPIAYLLHFLLAALNGYNIESEKSFIKYENIYVRLLNKDISLICAQDTFMNYDAEGNINEEFFLIKDGFLQNILCDLTLCSRFKQINTATQFNYFNNMLTVSSASLKLEMNLPYNDAEYEFDVKFIDPRTAVFDFSTGLLDCQLIGYEKGSVKLEALHFCGSILSLINNAQFVSSDYLDLDDYAFKEYIVNIRKENEND